MISVEEALTRILNFVNVLGTEDKHLLDCLGQVLAEDVYSTINVPPEDNSAMDGYALKAEDILSASFEYPKTLQVIGELPAGTANRLRIDPGTSIRIMTGAILPEGADVVVPFEDTDEQDHKYKSNCTHEINIYRNLTAGTNIRRCGEDITSGELIISQGKILHPADIGLIASVGKEVVSVTCRPLVGILVTGNEVVDINKPLSPGKIYNSNAYSLAAQVVKYGGIPKLLGIAPDNMEQLSMAIRRGLDCDMLITSGGVSKGDYDIVKDVLANEGDISFQTVRMKPGKPLAFGTFNHNGRKVPHLGLPGNPVSSMITFEIFARPAIFKMMGKKDLIRSTVKAVMEDSVKNSDCRRIFDRVIVMKREDKYFARLTGPQGSGILSSMVKANGLAIIPETVEQIEPGTIVDVILLNEDEN